MTNYLWYIFEANVAIALLFALFKLIQRRLSFTTQRFLLLSVPVLSLLAIWLKEQPFAGSWTYKIPVVELEPVYIGSVPETHSIHSAPASEWLSVGLIYWIGVLILSVLAARKLLIVLRLFLKARRKKEAGFTVIELPEQESFSFFRFIQLRKDLTPEDREIVFQHEQLHARKLHSFDHLFMEAVHCFSWFNPLLPFMKKELIHIHEFEVDRIMYDRHSVHYMEFLVSYALGTSSSSYLFTNQFLTRLTLVKRINNMKHTSKKTWMLALALPVAAGVLTLISWTAGHNDGSAEREKGGRVLAVKNTELKADEPAGRKELLAEPDKNEKMIAEKKISTDKETYPDDEKLLKLIEPVKTDEVKDYGKNKKFMTMEEYQDVQKPAQFKGGNDALNAYMVKNTHYPELKEKMVSGKVYVSFMVSKTGKVSNVTIKRGVHPELDAEAKRVVSEMPDWIPGENNGEKIDSEMILPVAFNFEKEKVKETVKEK